MPVSSFPEAGRIFGRFYTNGIFRVAKITAFRGWISEGGKCRCELVGLYLVVYRSWPEDSKLRKKTPIKISSCSPRVISGTSTLRGRHFGIVKLNKNTIYRHSVLRLDPKLVQARIHEVYSTPGNEILNIFDNFTRPIAPDQVPKEREHRRILDQKISILFLIFDQKVANPCKSWFGS